MQQVLIYKDEDKKNAQQGNIMKIGKQNNESYARNRLAFHDTFHKVVLEMHCVDEDASVLSILRTKVK